ncbi:hypothetical protein ACVMAJ_002185 [Bradyrhizobium sp. USDA 4448]
MKTSARASATRCCWPPGELPGPPLRQGFHLDHAQRRADAVLRFGLARVAHGERESDILRDRQMRKQGIVLEYHADVALVGRHVLDRPVREIDLAPGGDLEARQHHQRGRLARARRAEQGDELALPDVEIEVLHHEVLAIVGFLNAGKAHQCRRRCDDAGFHVPQCPLKSCEHLVRGYDDQLSILQRECQRRKR